MTSTTDTLIGLIGDLRAAADWLEANLGTAPTGRVYAPAALVLSLSAEDEADMLEITRWLARDTSPGAPLRKGVFEGSVEMVDVQRDFGRLYLWAHVPREQVCERVVVGTETVEVPDPDFPVPMVTVERERVEWVCNPLLAERLATREEARAGLAEARATISGRDEVSLAFGNGS